ncbi:MAG: hypothetical protein M3M95_04320, partial [Pseudomonadota bacterium]|nr:hypothetical protein [Pseudomonadota bacterium]
MIGLKVKSAAAGLVGLVWAAAAVAQPAFDPKPWLEDLRQARDAMSAHYANLEWAVRDRGVDLPDAYPRLEAAMSAAKSEAEARRLFERFLSAFGDGHLRVEWPAGPAAVPAGTSPTAAAKPLCEQLGFSDWGEDRSAVAWRLPGYVPLADSPAGALFPA